MIAVASVPAVAATKLYGELHTSYDEFDVDGGNTNSKDGFALNSTVIGVKGSSELNSDYSAIYKMEWGVDTSINSVAPIGSKKSAISNRNQVIGFAGSFGAIIIGRYDTPLKTVGRKADLFWHSQLGQNRNMTNPAAWDLRADKIIAYQTPKINGFQGLVSYATDIAGSSDNSAISLNGFYKFGPIQLGAAYEQQDLGDLNTKRDAIRLMSAYKEGPLKLVAFFQNEDNAFTATGDPDATVYGIGASYKKGAGTFKGQYYSRDIDATSDDPDLIALGYDYKLIKSTDVYVQYASVSKGQKLGGSGHGASSFSTTGGDTDGLSVGIRHKF